jgi:hypothetical protein
MGHARAAREGGAQLSDAVHARARVCACVRARSCECVWACAQAAGRQRAQLGEDEVRFDVACSVAVDVGGYSVLSTYAGWWTRHAPPWGGGWGCMPGCVRACGRVCVCVCACVCVCVCVRVWATCCNTSPAALQHRVALRRIRRHLSRQRASTTRTPCRRPCARHARTCTCARQAPRRAAWITTRVCGQRQYEYSR